MNPQDQPNTPSTDNDLRTAPTGNGQVSSNPVTSNFEQSTSEADAVALQAIEALESEELGATKDPEVSVVDGAPVVTTAPAEMETPVTTGSSFANSTSSNQTASTPNVPPVEAPAAGVAAAVGVQAATNTQTPASTPVTLATEKKKSSKFVVILLVVVLVVVAVATGYFIWQSM